MEALKYTVIKSTDQYNEYCKILESLVCETRHENNEDAIELLTLLIEKWDESHNTFKEVDPVQLLKYLMEEHKLKSVDLAAILELNKGLVSEILSYKKGLSKTVIRKLAAYFKLSQEAFNRPYKLVSPLNAHLKNASVMNTRKDINVQSIGMGATI